MDKKKKECAFPGLFGHIKLEASTRPAMFKLVLQSCTKISISWTSDMAWSDSYTHEQL